MLGLRHLLLLAIAPHSLLLAFALGDLGFAIARPPFLLVLPLPPLSPSFVAIATLFPYSTIVAPLF